MPKFLVKAMAIVEFEVDFPSGTTAAQARTRLVDESHWSYRQSCGYVDSIIRVEDIEQVSGVDVMSKRKKRQPT